MAVPYTLAQRRYPGEDLGWGLWWKLHVMRGTRVELTVTDIEVAADGELRVEGTRPAGRAWWK